MTAVHPQPDPALALPGVLEAAGRALREAFIEVTKAGSAAVAWDDLDDRLRARWRERAVPVVAAVLAAAADPPSETCLVVSQPGTD